jgi:hypothetical protein
MRLLDPTPHFSVHAFGRSSIAALRALAPSSVVTRVAHGVQGLLSWPIDPGAEPWVLWPDSILSVVDDDDDVAVSGATEWARVLPQELRRWIAIRGGTGCDVALSLAHLEAVAGPPARAERRAPAVSAAELLREEVERLVAGGTIPPQWGRS